MSRLTLLLVLFSSVCFAQSDADIAQLLIEKSVASYSGNCPCPYNVTANGSRCGKRSAYSRPGGYAPLCYAGDVSQQQIQAWKSLNGVPVAKVAVATAGTMEQGSYSLLYDRKDWPHWIDEDGDCQNTRQEILIEASMVPVDFTKQRKCTVLSGKWFDVYTGDVITQASAIDIDHLVPLKWANGHGGSEWSRERKRKFANDDKNLIPTTASVNRSKGFKGPDEWMPPRHEYRCEYLKRFDGVVISYGLKYTPAEKRVIDRMKKACG